MYIYICIHMCKSTTTGILGFSGPRNSATSDTTRTGLSGTFYHPAWILGPSGKQEL